VETLLDLVNQKPIPEPWEEGDNIPWDEPGFSQRMLAEHLSQAHDMASRRAPKTEEHVRWIHSEVLGERPTRVLDLCCGPGLYTSRLAALGHECVGIDFSPAAIAYAQEQAVASQVPCRYVREDVRAAEFGAGFELVMMVFGQFNVFRPTEACTLLNKARRALTDGGVLVLEAHALSAVECMGTSGASWYSTAQGLFSPRPHLVLEEHFWHAETKAATTRFFVVDVASGRLTAHAMTTQGYSDDEYRSLLAESGCDDTSCSPSLTGQEDPSQPDFVVLRARAGSAHRPSQRRCPAPQSTGADRAARGPHLGTERTLEYRMEPNTNTNNYEHLALPDTGGTVAERIDELVKALLLQGEVPWASPTMVLLGQYGHLGGLAATQMLARQAKFSVEDIVLDVCCYVGGPARYLAATTGCRVVGVDRDEKSIAIARRLTALAGCQDRVSFLVGDLYQVH